MSARLMDPRRKDGSYPFAYRSSVKTDVRETFERIRREQQAQPQNVRTLTSTRARKS